MRWQRAARRIGGGCAGARSARRSSDEGAGLRRVGHGGAGRAARVPARSAGGARGLDRAQQPGTAGRQAARSGPLRPDGPRTDRARTAGLRRVLLLPGRVLGGHERERLPPNHLRPHPCGGAHPCAPQPVDDLCLCLGCGNRHQRAWPDHVDPREGSYGKRAARPAVARAIHVSPRPHRTAARYRVQDGQLPHAVQVGRAGAAPAQDLAAQIRDHHRAGRARDAARRARRRPQAHSGRRGHQRTVRSPAPQGPAAPVNWACVRATRCSPSSGRLPPRRECRPPRRR